MSKSIDETGKQYFNLTVVKRHCRDRHGNVLWLCVCTCGKETIARTNALHRRLKRSCGCIKRTIISHEQYGFINEIGRRHGKLTVISQIQGRSNNSIQWLCRCDCGNEKVVRGNKLRSGEIRSCGCLRKFPDGEASFNDVLENMKRGARDRGYGWELTRDDVRRLTKQNCYYCGIPPSNRARQRGMNGSYIYNGIDRVDNSKGYSIENTVPCCKTCNITKKTMTQSDFLGWVNRVYNHSIKLQSSNDRKFSFEVEELYEDNLGV